MESVPETTEFKYPPSLSCQRLLSHLSLARRHLKVVNAALVEVAARKTPKGKGSYHRQLTNYAIGRNAELTVQLMYTHFTEYLRSMLREMYAKRPLMIVDKAQGSLRFHEIVQLGNYDAICDYMVDYVFRRLEDLRSPRGLLDKILDKTGVTIAPDTLQTALLYIELRHLLVHNAGIVDEKFKQEFGSQIDVTVGKKLTVSVGTAKKALEGVRQLCIEIDQGLIEKGFLVSGNSQPKNEPKGNINNQAE